jgi:hypothetical protein
MVRFILALCLVATAAHAEPGYTVTAGGGLNVDAPYAEAQLGRRFVRAPFLELFVDYSFNAAISEFTFHTLGAGVRTYFLHRGRVELFHQALAAFGVSSSGDYDNRDLGQRVLGAFLTQGAGVQLAFNPCWNVALTVSTGTPVWLRPELAARFTW